MNVVDNFEKSLMNDSNFQKEHVLQGMSYAILY